VLDITNVDVVFGECAGIVFQNGSYLRANNSVFRPCEIDKTWKGLRFNSSGEFDNIINESTFKNAEVALYFQDGADAVISDNLFSNCNYGIRVENNIYFNHPISGNRFVTDDFFPSFSCQTKYGFVDDFSSYGIYSTTARFLKQVSHNEFLNSKGTSFPSVYGIYQVFGGGLFSENNFTDMAISVYLGSQLYYSAIENNEIEVNQPNVNNQATIYISGNQGPIVEINNNEISNNYNNYLRFAGIYSNATANVSILNNEIEGFYYGIIDIYSTNHQISNNEVFEARNYGICVYEQSFSRGYITCNSIKMKNFNNNIGFVGFNLSPATEVSSNCITDCYTSMHYYGLIGGSTSTVLPLIRNNYLYNYKYVGINVQNCTGNIGIPASPGLNTLWSNNNSAVDINSNTNITVADNFGMFNISWPQVQIVSNNPYHSTASCGHQIFNMPSQGNLNFNYVCDNFGKMIQTLKGAAGQYNLTDNFRDYLKSSPNQYDDANLILSSVEEPDIWLLNEILDITSLDDNERALLKYNYFKRSSDYINAMTSLNDYMPVNDDDIDLKLLSLFQLDVVEHGWGVLTETDLTVLSGIIEKRSENQDLAISLLNNYTFMDHTIFGPGEFDVVQSANVKRIRKNDSFLSIYPNPVTDRAFVELIDNNDMYGKIELFDNSGKVVTNYSINFVAGGMELDISNLSEGFYIVTLTNPESGFIQKGKMIKVNR